MKYQTAFFLLIVMCCWHCQPVESSSESNQLKSSAPVQLELGSFQELLDSSLLEGAILITNAKADTFWTNDFAQSQKTGLPASTYKIPNSIIALETGVVEDENTFFKWDGEKRRMAMWEKDMIFREAFHISCVPCYQQIARQIGVERMNTHLQKFNYGQMDVNEENIDLFWLEGESRISARQQIDFLKKFYEGSLPVSTRTTAIMKRLMVIEENEQYRLSGKTGWAIRDGSDIGWFVGYVEVKGRVYYFATRVVPKAGFDMDGFASARRAVTRAALRRLKITP